MSLWKPAWDHWSARLSSAVELAKFYSSVGAARPDFGGPIETLYSNARELFGILITLEKEFRDSLPQEARTRLSEFIQGATAAKQFENQRPASWSTACLWLGLLSSIRMEVAYYLGDVADQIRKDVERALLHLQRSVVADPSVRSAWKSAFAQREERCEALGAAHLLQHGIWAFKVNAAGGRTDLVLGGSLREADVLRSGTALVLTEWKMIRDRDDPEAKAKDAQSQAEKYATGALAGVELAETRYVILVSQGYISSPPPLPSTERATYLVRTVAVDPELPSALASRARNKSARNRRG